MARENNESYKPVRQKEKNLYVHFIFSREIYEESMNVEYCARRSEESEHDLVFQCSICT
ncbi:hypothetical protein [Anaerobiospirillum thomasii]|uniref:Uncharacterized protein n=1 Tax=Anaerobiospirillum thomasii TaxID=179995 RepID=A0A2X0VM16_9GAMM|nr:hypothetical protein [Anaerobiospirillum thomasii]SPT68770.1 Uncharacterised protein [Anaerobiospirillum thomasii]